MARPKWRHEVVAADTSIVGRSSWRWWHWWLWMPVAHLRSAEVRNAKGAPLLHRCGIAASLLAPHHNLADRHDGWPTALRLQRPTNRSGVLVHCRGLARCGVRLDHSTSRSTEKSNRNLSRSHPFHPSHMILSLTGSILDFVHERTRASASRPSYLLVRTFDLVRASLSSRVL